MLQNSCTSAALCNPVEIHSLSILQPTASFLMSRHSLYHSFQYLCTPAIYSLHLGLELYYITYMPPKKPDPEQIKRDFEAWKEGDEYKKME